MFLILLFFLFYLVVALLLILPVFFHCLIRLRIFIAHLIIWYSGFVTIAMGTIVRRQYFYTRRIEYILYILVQIRLNLIHTNGITYIGIDLIHRIIITQ